MLDDDTEPEVDESAQAGASRCAMEHGQCLDLIPPRSSHSEPDGVGTSCLVRVKRQALAALAALERKRDELLNRSWTRKTRRAH